MAAFADGLADRGWRVIRFEFPYMAARRADGRKRPPDREPVLLDAWRAAVEDIPAGHLVVGGKSLGGRMASLIAGELGARACLCLGYPFHPPGKPDRLRIAHLQEITVPTLIVQGTRDALGTQDEVAGYPLGKNVHLHWSEDGDHSLKPRKASGRTEAQNWNEAIVAIDGFLHETL